MALEDDDLIGGGDDIPSALNIGEDLAFRTDPEVHGINGGVSVAWLMKAFRMGRQTIERRLVGCAPIGKGKHSSPLYDLPEAASFIVIPKRAITDYLRDVKPEDLPENLREGVWNAKLKQQRFEEKAGDLWRTTRVIETISDLLVDLRSKMTLIPDETERAAGINREQRRKLAEIVEAIQDDMYKSILDLQKTRFTPNQLGEEAMRRREEGDDEDII
jgi:hypothetical protein